MEIKITETPAGRIGEVVSGGIILAEPGDVSDVISECFSNDVNGMIMDARHIAPEFFDLRTGIAGEILQKFTQYHIRFAIVGDFSGVESRSLRDFIRESNRAGSTLFVATAAEAMERFSVK